MNRNFNLALHTGVTRFKGLGDISQKEFAQFIGKEMRLSKVEYAPRAESAPIFNFYMSGARGCAPPMSQTRERNI